MGAKERVSSSTEIAASPEVVYALVTDLPRMGEWSPENTGGEWVRGGGPVVGARFKGTNEYGRKKWTTTVTVTDASAPNRFAFVNIVGPKQVSEWVYEIAAIPDGSGCVLTETWTQGYGPLMSKVGSLVTGVGDRVEHTREMIEKTLAGIKRTAEAAS